MADGNGRPNDRAGFMQLWQAAWLTKEKGWVGGGASADLFIAHGMALLLDDEAAGAERFDEQRVGEGVYATVGEALATQDKVVAPQFPVVVLRGGVLDGGGDALAPALEARLDLGGVGHPSAEDVALL